MKTVAALSILSAIAAAAPLEATTFGSVPDPSKVRIKSVGYAGTGCPQGSAYASISADASTMTVLFDSYVATVGKGASPRDQRKACTLNLEVLYPSGYQFSVFKVRTQGYINTDPGVSGQVRNSYFFSGQPGVASSTTNIPGNTKGNWKKEDAVNNASSVFSPCGGDGIVNIQTSIALQTNDPNANGYISADSIDAGFDQKFRQDYGLDWRGCPGGSPQGSSPLPPPSSGPFGGDDDDAPIPAPAPAPFTPPSPAPFTPPSSSPYSSPFGGSPYGGQPFGGQPFGGSPFGGNPYTSYNPYAGGIVGPVTGQQSSPWTTVSSSGANGWPF